MHKVQIQSHSELLAVISYNVDPVDTVGYQLIIVNNKLAEYH